MEERLDLKHNVLIELIRQLNPGSSVQDKEKQAVLDEELPSPPRINSRPRMVVDVPFRRATANPVGTRDQKYTRYSWPCPNQGNGTKLPLPKNPKVDIHVFNGEGDVLNWLHQIEHVFTIHCTHIEKRVEFCCSGALVWWRWLEKQKGGYVSWPEFYEEMRLQYGPHELDDPMSALANLKQVGTVQEYHKSFIKVAHLVDDTEKNLISLFLAGLKEDLRGKVKLDKPLAMVAAYKSACARESIIALDKKIAKWPSIRILVPITCNPIIIQSHQWSCHQGKK